MTFKDWAERLKIIQRDLERANQSNHPDADKDRKALREYISWIRFKMMGVKQ